MNEHLRDCSHAAREQHLVVGILSYKSHQKACSNYKNPASF